MFSRRTDLQLERDQLGRFLPWLIAFMVYLSVLALAGMLVLDDVAQRWDRGISGTLTVQMPPITTTATAAAKSSAAIDQAVRRDDKRMRAALAVLKSTPGVASAEILGSDKLMALLEPWLGAAASGADLPLPRLIDVTLAGDAKLDIQALQQRLQAVIPGAEIDDHGIWLEHLINLIQTVKALALAVLVFIALATTATVIFTTRTGLAIHHEAIEVLHLIGAQDSYIARQFASRALVLGLRGGVIGLLLALPTIWGIGVLARSLQTGSQNGLLPDISLGPGHWLILAILPLAVALIAMISARLTVMKTLGKML